MKIRTVKIINNISEEDAKEIIYNRLYIPADKAIIGAFQAFSFNKRFVIFFSMGLISLTIFFIGIIAAKNLALYQDTFHTPDNHEINILRNGDPLRLISYSVVYDQNPVFYNNPETPSWPRLFLLFFIPGFIFITLAAKLKTRIQFITGVLSEREANTFYLEVWRKSGELPLLKDSRYIHYEK